MTVRIKTFFTKFQRGVADPFTLIVLLAGLFLGLYLVGQRTNLFPRAQTPSESLSSVVYPVLVQVKCEEDESCGVGKRCGIQTCPLPALYCPPDTDQTRCQPRPCPNVCVEDPNAKECLQDQQCPEGYQCNRGPTTQEGIAGNPIGICRPKISPFPPSVPPSQPSEDLPEKTDKGKGVVCIQVITPARDTKTGECREFPTPCDIPNGWEKVSSCPTPPPTPLPTPEPLSQKVACTLGDFKASFWTKRGGPKYNSACDANNDGKISLSDYSVLLKRW